jgi:uncharacterized protein YcbK (DUF882 family)
MSGTKNFNADEFKCHCGCSENSVDMSLLYALQAVRDIIEIPMKISSGYRCVDHNKDVGGADTSSHLRGLAADIAVYNSSQAFILMRGIIISNRFKRIGYGKMNSGELVLHVDIDSTKVQEVLWGY